MTKKHEKFTKEELQDFCSNNSTLSEFGQKMGYANYSNAGIKAAKEAIEKYVLNTDSLTTYSNVVLGINPNKGKIDYSKFKNQSIKKTRRSVLKKNFVGY